MAVRIGLRANSLPIIGDNLWYVRLKPESQFPGIWKAFYSNALSNDCSPMRGAVKELICERDAPLRLL